MASSQVEIASSSPFGYVLKDRNRHDHRYRTRESNAFQKNFKDLVQTHLNSCGPGHSRNSGSVSNGKLNSNENSPRHHIDFTDLWVHNPQRNNNENNPKESRAGEKWDKARDMVFAFERKSQENTSSGGPNSPVKSESSVEAQSLGGVSSLVRMWRDFEAEARCFSATNSPVCSSRSNSVMFFNDNSSYADAPLRGPDAGEEFADLRPATPSKSEDLFLDWESDQTGLSGPPSSRGRDSDATESERIRVADIIKKLSSKGEDHNDTISQHSLPRVRTSLEKAEQRVFSPVSSSPRIRGRQAFTDLLMHLERDRHRELERLVDKKAVSRFSHRGRIQAMLRVRFLRRGAEGKDGRQSNSASFDSKRLAPSAIVNIRMIKWIHGFPLTKRNLKYKTLSSLLRNPNEYQITLWCYANFLFLSTSSCIVIPLFSQSIPARMKLRIQFLFKPQFMMWTTLHSIKRYVGKDLLYIRKGNALMWILVIFCSSHFRLNYPSWHAMERFMAQVRHSGTDSRSQQGEAVDKITEGEKSPMIYQQRKENHQQELTEPTKSPKAVVDNDVDAQEPIRENQIVGTNYHGSNTTVRQNAVQVQRSEILHQEAISSPGVMQQRTSSGSENDGKTEVTSTANSMKMDEANENSEIEESSNQNLIASTNGFMDDAYKAQGDWKEDEGTHQDLVVSDYGQETDVFQPFEWEELQDDYEQEVDMNQDWISDVSRPRSTWEDLRQARYQEMLDPFMQNDEIRQLLNRKSVSNFLSSGLREGIDRLMMSRTQSQPNEQANQRQEEHNSYQVEEVTKKVEMQEVQKEPEERVEEEEEIADHSNDLGEDESDEIQTGREYTESQDYFGQTTSWDYNQDNEVGDNYFDPTEFESPEQPLSPSSPPETQPSSSFTNHPSIEMEFIYELRGNMEQLHQEISELRRSVKSCIDMQVKLQESFTRDVTTASCHSGTGRKKRKDSSQSKKSGRGRCYICYEMQIDSLLYRCGHMCTCFKCASDLQWGSGKCPICQAPIIDVVRAYACS
ncbi:unnamed protein product [Coffea canephora]|uniref:RING-type domain-containing protein n=1 Tax=Coffea canephora TaxID=49390 RepID=A0A068U6G6_COFCA|nr:unnamed protein product [Coffea canephora]